MPPISVCIASYNAAASIGRALESARACSWCSELIVVDSGSTDGTDEIARGLADRVEHRPWIDSTTSKKALVEAAAHDWVFILDHDEEISPPLAEEIAGLRETAFKQHAIFTMPRRNYVLGRHVRSWDPDPCDRLFHRRQVAWRQRAIHDRREPLKGDYGRLYHPLLHNRNNCEFRLYFDGPRYAQWADVMAREMYDAGRRVSGLGLLVRPPLALLKFLILKRGFLQGTFGLLIAQKAAAFTQLKYARLWALQEEAHGCQPGAQQRQGNAL